MIQVRRSTYRDKPGWSVVGHPKGEGVGGWPVSIWVHHESTARQIAALYKATPRDDLAIDRLIREEKGMKTYAVRVREHYTFTVEAESKAEALKIAEEIDRDKWDLVYSIIENPTPIDATLEKV